MRTNPNKKSYRGVEIDAELVPLVRHMPAVDATRESLQSLQGVWDSLSLLGELSGTGVEIGSIRAAFAALTSRLVNQLGRQEHHKAALEQLAKAQVTIDILVRNLFERTADIGFLATDEDLRRYAQADAAGRETLAPALRERLREYQLKYSVYDDIILLSPGGEVLARLDESAGVPRTQDRTLLDETLHTTQPYVEAYRAFDLRPASPRSLVYAARIVGDDGRTPVAVLCLCFRFEDECRRIFRKFVGENDWSVVALLDAGGAVIASSDPFQVPLGAHVAAPDDGQAHVLRFAGRHWLAVSCDAHAFQGYAGPGWRGHAMTPLEHAFADGEDTGDAGADADTLALLRHSRRLHPDALREIAGAAHRIEADLARAVWNGNLALVAGDGTIGSGENNAFSRSLLREIGRTGTRTRDSFTQALAQMSDSVGAAALQGTQSRAALAADILDRSLYERANDCRWWALTTAFRTALESPGEIDPSTLERLLGAIHGLYTVYANLLLFDRSGRIVAVSRRDEAAQPGATLGQEWVARTLSLSTTQDYCVSDFAPSELYGGRPTYVFSAAVRGLAEPRQVVGGIAIVFDSEPQLRSMLHDTLPRDAQGEPLADAFGVFVDAAGRVIASSHDQPAVGSLIDAGGALRGGARSAPVNGQQFLVGCAAATGYREFKGPDDRYREQVTALVFEALGETAANEAGVAAAPPSRQPSAAGRRIDLATLRIGEQWHALVGRDVVGAIATSRLLPLPGRAGHVRGSVMFRDAPIAVLELDRLLGERVDPAPPQSRQIVVLRSAQGAGRHFGLLVDALGDNPEVSDDQLVRLAEGRWLRSPGGAALIDTVVAPASGAPDRALLTLLSSEALTGLLRAA
ncbi:chemotaxis protein CheW [Variovorax sp. YR752]|uniref:chemotaxis protein CheW n=1 Tax=Variovorax sp. YR752 TaxID=1884383 RepID=UPI003137B19E